MAETAGWGLGRGVDKGLPAQMGEMLFERLWKIIPE